MKKKVILTKKFQKEILEKLKKKFNLIVVEDSNTTFYDVIGNNPDCEALIPFLSDKIDDSVMKKLPLLKIIANYAVGYNNIDVNAAKERGIFVTNTPDILTDATADLTFALILAVSRRIVESDKFMRRGNFKGWGANLLLGKELRGSVLGIIGMGKIGTETAIRSLGFGMKVIYFSRRRKPELEKQYGFKYVSFNELISRADIISPHIPYTKEVHHLFNKDTFRMMKNSAIFINVSRGALVNEENLADSLENGELYGAGLDVYEFEPAVNRRLIPLENVVMTPHTGSATYRARLGMAEMVYKNVSDGIDGKLPENLIIELKDKGDRK